MFFFFFFENFPSRLKALRIEKELTLQELGAALGSTKQTMGNFENGNKTPSLELLIKIAEYFGVSLDYLVGRSDVREVQK